MKINKKLKNLNIDLINEVKISEKKFYGFIETCTKSMRMAAL